MAEMERALGRIEGQMEADGKAREAERSATESRQHSVNNKLQAITNQLATITEQLSGVGEITVRHEDLEIRVRTLEAVRNENQGRDNFKHWAVTLVLSLFGAGLGTFILRKLGIA